MPVLMFQNVKDRQVSKYVILIIYIAFSCSYLVAQQNDSLTFNINVNQVSPIEIFEILEAQSNKRFIYNAPSIDSLNQTISIKVHNASLHEVLTEIKKQSLLKFRESGNTIAVAIRKKQATISTLSGFIIDSITGEYLIGAVIYLPEYNIGAASNQFGYYSLSPVVEKAMVKVNYLGYKPIVFLHDFSKKATINFRLPPMKSLIKEVVVSTTTTKDIINENVEGVNKIGVRDLRNLPVTYSERDIVKSTHYLPGILRLAGGSSGYSVRGSSPSENLTIFDNSVMYNISHSLADLSIFNPDIIQDMQLYKGSVPAKFGGRCSSLLNVTMRNGNKNHFAVKGGISPVSTRLAIEGPIVKNKLSYLLSFRRSNYQLFKLRSNIIGKYYFDDINAKLHYKMNNKHKLALTSYFGKDYESYNLDKNLYMEQWETHASSLIWNYNIAPKLFVNTSVTYSYFQYSHLLNAYLFATISDIGGKQDLSWYVNPKNKLDIGWGLIEHKFYIGNDKPDSVGLGIEIANNIESYFYTAHLWKLTNNIRVSYGIRFTYFGDILGFKVKLDTILGSTLGGSIIEDIYSYGLLNKINIEPRLAFSYRIKPNQTIKVSFNRMVQNLHQVSYVGTSRNLFFIWVPSTVSIKPLILEQVSLGYYCNSNSSVFSYSIEAFYKKSRNNLNYFFDTLDGYNHAPNLQTGLLTADGKAFGIELFTRITKGDFKGNISYTISKSIRKSVRVNNGKWYLSNYHRPHNIAINLNYKLSDSWSISASWLYSTGMRSSISFEDLRNNNINFDIGKINYYKLPDYHRMDIGITYENYKKRNKKFRSSWSFNVYNVYNRKNGYIGEGVSQLVNYSQNNTSLFYDYNILPSISYNFNFR